MHFRNSKGNFARVPISTSRLKTHEAHNGKMVFLPGESIRRNNCIDNIEMEERMYRGLRFIYNIEAQKAQKAQKLLQELYALIHDLGTKPLVDNMKKSKTVL